MNLVLDVPLSVTTFKKYVPDVKFETSTVETLFAFGRTSTNCPKTL